MKVSEVKQVAVARTAGHRRLQSKLAVFGLVGIVLIGVVAYGIVRFVRSHDSAASKVAMVRACEQTVNVHLLDEGAAALRASDTTQLSITSAAIRRLPDYRQDPNCLYILTWYDILSSDSQDARTQVTALQKVYDSRTGFNRHLGQAASLHDTEQAATALEKNTNSSNIFNSGNGE